MVCGIFWTEVCLSMDFFVFKQKTAYEMRISDWSSDVCASDLERPCPASRRGQPIRHASIRLPHMSQPRPDPSLPEIRKTLVLVGLMGAGKSCKIGRATCRERVCPYV